MMFAYCEGAYIPILETENVGQDLIRSGVIVCPVDASFDHEFGTERVWEWDWDYTKLRLVWVPEHVQIPDFPIRGTYTVSDTAHDANVLGGSVEVQLELESLVVRRALVRIAGEEKLVWHHSATVTPSEATP